MKTPEKIVSINSVVSLRDITKDTFFEFCQLSVSEQQKNFVDSVAESMAEANFTASAWFQGIYADETPVGFLMLDDQPDISKYYIWRFMIDQRFQGIGLGRQALDLLIKYVRTRPNATELLTSVMLMEGGALEFYRKAGFELTGESIDRTGCPNQAEELALKLIL